MNCHLEPASQDPIPTFPPSCKTLGPAVQIQEVSAACGLDTCCLILSSGGPKPRTKFLNQFPTKPGKTGEDLDGGKGGDIVCASSD